MDAAAKAEVLTPPHGRLSFSNDNPHLQIGWDSTSLGTFKECPRKYYYTIVLGYAPRQESVHLKFGAIYHSALEHYDHAKFAGASHVDAQREALRQAMLQTWDTRLSRPWFSDDEYKNRFTLVRSVVWYLEQFADDPIETVRLANGKPAVELSFRFDLGMQSHTGEDLLYSGHLDRLGKLNGQVYVLDRKTTKTSINNDYFDKYSPDNQFSGYMTAAKIVYNQPAVGLIVDAAQVGVTFSRFYRGFVNRTESQLNEWLSDTRQYIAAAERMAESGYWPMNDKSCNNYGGCPFRSICAKDPSTRELWLKADFTRRVWDPLQVRGDI